MVVLLDALLMIDVPIPIMTSDGKLVLSAKPSLPYYSGSPVEEMNRVCS